MGSCVGGFGAEAGSGLAAAGASELVLVTAVRGRWTKESDWSWELFSFAADVPEEEILCYNELRVLLNTESQKVEAPKLNK